MKKVILISTVAFLALTLVCCSNSSDQPLTAKTVETISPPNTILSDYEKREKIHAENIAISKAQEIPTGKEAFEKMVAYIWKHGFTITGGPNKIPCGKQYTFFDSKGNRHAYLAIKTDTVKKEASMTGTVVNIFTYGYRDGIKDQDHFFPYDINATSMYCPILETDGTWEGVKEATLGYNEFLAKVSK